MSLRTLLVLFALTGSAGLAHAGPAAPCVDEARRTEFAFWVGEWDVHLGDGRLAGRNSIRFAEADCRIDEHWRGAGGGTGSSINFVDPIDGRWEQVWHSPNGTFIRIRGGLEAPGDMLLTGTIHYLAQDLSAPFRGRWTLLEDGRVRQFFEQYDAASEAWQPWFEGFYTRSEEAEEAGQ